MLVIGYWELVTEDVDEVISLYQQAIKDREEGKLNHPKMVSDNYMFSGENNGFRLFEVSDPIQLENLKYYYYPKMEWEFLPIIKAEESIKAYMESKK